MVIGNVVCYVVSVLCKGKKIVGIEVSCRSKLCTIVDFTEFSLFLKQKDHLQILWFINIFPGLKVFVKIKKTPGKHVLRVVNGQ